MKFRNAVEIKRPIEEVYSFLADFENTPRWNYAVQETKRISSGTQKGGAKYWQRREFLGRDVEDTYEVVEYTPNKAVAVKSISGPFPFEFRYSFEGGTKKTELTNDIHLETKGVFKIMDRVLQPRVKEAIARNLSTLKKLLEKPNHSSSHTNRMKKHT